MTTTREIAGGITAPARLPRRRRRVRHQGHRASLDLAIVASQTAASAAAVFTTNLAQAAPVLVSRDHLERSGGRARAIVVNSGCANACTGADGLAHARDDGRADRGGAVGCAPEQVLVASTGVIGVKLNMRRSARGIS